MKRVGERGQGKFQRISWDEALETLAKELLRVRDKYGPASILFKWSGGDTSVFHNAMCHYRVLNFIGGCSDVWGTFSFDGGLFAEQATFGWNDTGNTRDDLLNSRLIIMWGWNPSVTIQNTNTAWYLAQAKDAGIRMVAIDPRYSESNATFADEWIPIIPGTDCAMLMAMAHFACLFFYGLGGWKLGELGTSVGFAIFQTGSVLVGNILGFATGEWKNASVESKRWLYIGLAVLVLGIAVVSTGNAI
jgi:anaerobic selenocysteine-containing dehydrogenase